MAARYAMLCPHVPAPPRPPHSQRVLGEEGDLAVCCNFFGDGAYTYCSAHFSFIFLFLLSPPSFSFFSLLKLSFFFLFPLSERFSPSAGPAATRAAAARRACALRASCAGWGFQSRCSACRRA